MKDYAEVKWMGRWLRHPVMGDPSFDSFEKTGNTAYVSAPPYEWAVNGSLSEAKDGSWILYAGLYPRGYADVEGLFCHFEILRSADKGQTWTNLGEGLAKGHVFEGFDVPSDSCPDVVVIWDEKKRKYLMTYDWGTNNMNWSIAHDSRGTKADSGSAIAYSDSLTGPFIRCPRPVFRNKKMHGRFGRFDRFYATTVIPRKNDYLALVLCDSGPSFAWGLASMTSADPEKEFENPRIVLSADRPDYYPAPMEFYPAFVVDDMVYAPATSVARNRNYQFMFCAPLEEAHKPEAWQMAADGNLWHSRPIEDEKYGIWGQTFHGFIDSDGNFTVMYPSRNSKGMGTLSVARRPWNTPHSNGFTFSGHDGPSVTLLRDAYAGFRLTADFTLSGSVDFLFDFSGKIGPNEPSSDCIPCPESLTEYRALRICGRCWYYIEYGDLIAQGSEKEIITSVGIDRTGKSISFSANGSLVLSAISTLPKYAPIGLRMHEFSVLTCTSFKVEGKSVPARFIHNAADALQGAGVGENRFEKTAEGYIGSERVKWNIHGSHIKLKGDCGTEYGKARLLTDGRILDDIDFSGKSGRNRLLYEGKLEKGAHGIELIPLEGRYPVPELTVW